MPRWRRGLHDEARGWPGGGAAKGGRRGAAGDQAAPLCWLLCGGLGCAAAAGCCCVGIRPRRCLLGLLCGGLGCAAVAGFCCAGIRPRRFAGLLCGGLGCAAAAGVAGWGSGGAAARWVAVHGIRPRRCLLGLLCGGLGCAAVAGFCCIDLVVLLCGVDLVGGIGRRCGGEGGSSVWVGSRIRSSTGSGGFPRATCLP
jgi:hypothetical protein